MKVLTANEVLVNRITIGKYIKHLCNAFIFYVINCYLDKMKKICLINRVKRFNIVSKQSMA